MLRLVFAVVSLVGILGCDALKSDALRSCQRPENAMSVLCTDGGTTGGFCRGPDDCDDPRYPVCKMPSATSGTCVACTGNEHCRPEAPICGSDNVCAGCTSHEQCPDSEVCLPSGACAAPNDVAYAAENGSDGAECTKQMPCKKIDDAARKKSIVKVRGMITDRCMLNTGTVQIFAVPDSPSVTGASLKSGNGIALEIKGSANVEVYDLLISKTGDAVSAVSVSEQATLKLTRVTVRGNPGNGIATTDGQVVCTRCTVANNEGRGIDVTMNGSVTITQSTIASNASGGIRVQDNGAFRIVSNFIFDNGQSGRADSGGVRISVNVQPTGSPPNELDFNSVSRNTNSSVAQGIDCTTGTSLVASNNIVWNNGIIPATAAQVANNSNCSYSYSDIGPIGIAVDTNKTVDPMFANEATGDLHLTADSTGVLMVNPSARLSGLAEKDIDGQTRTNPADIGADQRTGL